MCGLIPSHTPSHSRNCKCDSQVTLLVHTFPWLCLGREPKAKVVTHDDTHANFFLSFNFHPTPHPSHYKWFESKCQCACLGKEVCQRCIKVWNFHYVITATLLWKSVKMKFTLPKWGLGNPPRLLKLQSSIVGVKTPCIRVFFISLKSYWSADVENGLAWAIWTSTAHVMAKRKVGVKLAIWLPTTKSRELTRP